MTDLVLASDADGVRTLTLNRPDARNAFNRALYEATARALDVADTDDSIKVVVLNGAGRGFSAGQDLSELAPITDAAEASGGPTMPHGFHPFIESLERFGKPLIAAVHGHAIGIGCTMLAYFDLVVVADDALLRMPFVALGMVPEAGSTDTMPSLVGRQLASYLLLSGETVDGPTAVRAGLALRCVAAAELATEVAALAAQLGAMPTASLLGTKQLLRASWHERALEARAREERLFAAHLRSEVSTAAVAKLLRRDR